MFRHVARAGIHQEEGTNTTHFAVADRWGNIVSYTTSIEAIWGSGLMVPGFGFLLNNQLTDFNATPQRHGQPSDADCDPGANDVAPFKRPRSSMTPTIVFERFEGGERPVAAYGSPGGSTIINTVLNIAIDLIDHRMTAADAVARPRLSLTNAGDSAKTTVEAGFDPAVLEKLRGLGYRIGEAPAGGIGAVQAVVIDPGSGLLSGEADPRRNGTVIGLPPATQTPIVQTTSDAGAGFAIDAAMTEAPRPKASRPEARRRRCRASTSRPAATDGWPTATPGRTPTRSAWTPRPRRCRPARSRPCTGPTASRWGSAPSTRTPWSPSGCSTATRTSPSTRAFCSAGSAARWRCASDCSTRRSTGWSMPRRTGCPA